MRDPVCSRLYVQLQRLRRLVGQLVLLASLPPFRLHYVVLGNVHSVLMTALGQAVHVVVHLIVVFSHSESRIFPVLQNQKLDGIPPQTSLLTISRYHHSDSCSGAFVSEDTLSLLDTV